MVKPKALTVEEVRDMLRRASRDLKAQGPRTREVPGLSQEARKQIFNGG